jgi:hypothetical protein
MFKYLFSILLLVNAALFAQNEIYHKAKILTGKEGLKKLGALGVCIDHGQVKKNTWFVSDFSQSELTKIKQAGLAYELLIKDVSNYYQERNTTDNLKTANTSVVQCNNGTVNFPFPSPTHFHLGSMGGFFTYNEALQILDSMSLLYPALISNKAPVSLTKKTIEGRDIYYLRITSNVKPDNQKPEILYNALHHAREACSLSQLIYFMWYVLEYYGIDERITSIVDNTQMYFIPVVNPDGYLYNQQINPNGGGMWRKNRRVNGNNAFGVDLNRNYGYNWGLDDNGSSPDPTTDTYRGTSAFSEPETQILRDFVNGKNFKMSLNYHTYSNVLIFPWGYENTLCPDSNLFNSHCEYMSRENGFGYGNPFQTIGYVGNGAADDWLYADNSHTKVLSITPEAGAASDGFWPAINRIVPICQNTFIQNIKFAELALDIIECRLSESRYISSLCNYINYNVKRIGLLPGSNNNVSFTPISTNIQNVGNIKNYSGLNLLDEVNDSIEICLNPNIQNGEPVIFVINTSYANFIQKDTITLIYGTPSSVLTNNGSAVTGWTSSTANTWGVTTGKYVSSPSSISDSPNGNYADNRTTNFTLNNSINLSNVQSASLTFYASWALESGYDYVQVQVSSNNGVSWTSLCGKYTHPGSPDQDPGQPLYDGDQLSWVKEEMDLSNYIGQNIKLRFRLKSDGFVNEDGFYFDDLSVNTISAGTAIKNNVANQFNQLSIYPNPAKNALTIETNQTESQVEIYNASGKLILSENISKGKFQLNIAEWPQGVYLIKQSTREGEVFIEKLVVNK